MDRYCTNRITIKIDAEFAEKFTDLSCNLEEMTVAFSDTVENPKVQIIKKWSEEGVMQTSDTTFVVDLTPEESGQFEGPYFYIQGTFEYMEHSLSEGDIHHIRPTIMVKRQVRPVLIVPAPSEESEPVPEVPTV